MLKKWPVLFLLGCAGVVPAHPAAAQSINVWNGVYSEVQANRGKERFTGLCRRCHNDNLEGSERGPALKGDRFMSNWELQTVSRLFAKAKDTMPPDSPSSLSDEEYLDVVTHILRTNGFPPGADALKLEAAENVAIVRTPGDGPREVPNFALVRVVGCLTPEAESAWTLSQASDPVATADQPSTSQNLKEAGAAPLGSHTFRLVSVGSFSPESHKGHKMQARGLLYRAPNKDRLNLISLEMVGSSCGN